MVPVRLHMEQGTTCIGSCASTKQAHDTADCCAEMHVGILDPGGSTPSHCHSVHAHAHTTRHLHGRHPGTAPAHPATSAGGNGERRKAELAGNRVQHAAAGSLQHSQSDVRYSRVARIRRLCSGRRQLQTFLRAHPAKAGIIPRERVHVLTTQDH